MGTTKVYIIENDAENAQRLAQAIKDNLHFEALIFDDVKAAQKSAKIEEPDAIRALVLSIRLSMDNYTPLSDIPTILVTAHIPIHSRELLLAGNLVDTVAGYGGRNVAYILNLIRHISTVSGIKVLLVEGDYMVRRLIARNLSVLGVDVIEAIDAQSATNIFGNDEKIRLIFIDGDASDCLPFIRKQRENYGKTDLPIIALINENADTEKSMELLHAGALDCVKKEFASPASLEYFQTRIRLLLRDAVSYFQIEEMARFDSLTGTLNRRAFYEISENIFANFRRGNISIAVAILDIDNFKNINDTYGHSAGDAALLALCCKIREQVRKSDLVARFGGEEFCILLSGTEKEDALITLNRIRKSVEDMVVKYEDQEFSFTISAGCSHEDEPTMKNMLEIADKRLYIAKTSGKNCVVGSQHV